MIAAISDHLSTPVHFDKDIYFGPIELWVLASDVAKDLDFTARHELKSQTRYALFWNGPSELLSDEPDRLFALANLAAWLAKPGNFRLRINITFPHYGSSDGPRQTSWGNTIYLHPKYSKDSLSRSDLGAAAQLFQVLRSIQGKGALSTAIWTLWTALCQKDWIS